MFLRAFQTVKHLAEAKQVTTAENSSVFLFLGQRLTTHWGGWGMEDGGHRTPPCLSCPALSTGDLLSHQIRGSVSSRGMRMKTTGDGPRPLERLKIKICDTSASKGVEQPQLSRGSGATTLGRGVRVSS